VSGALALMLGSGGKSLSLVGKSAVAASSLVALGIARPANVQAGDLLIAFLTADQPKSWDGDTGWTERVDYGSRPGLWVGTKVAGASEPASYTFAMSGSAQQAGFIVAYRTASFDVIGSVGALSGTSVAAPSVTLSGAGLLLAFFGCVNASSTFSTPAGMAPLLIDKDGNSPSFGAFVQEVGAGATGSRTSTPDLGGTSAGVLIGIKAS
jgi:hypothetical protein